MTNYYYFFFFFTFIFNLPQSSIFGHILKMTNPTLNHVLHRSIKMINISEMWTLLILTRALHRSDYVSTSQQVPSACMKSVQSLCHPSLILIKVILCWGKLGWWNQKETQCSSVIINQSQHVSVSSACTGQPAELKQDNFIHCSLFLNQIKHIKPPANIYRHTND